MQKEFNVVVVEEHPITANALAELLGREPGMSVLSTLSGGRGLLDFLDEKKPDLILMGLRLGNADGIELIKSIRARNPELKILVFSMYEELEYARRVISAGAKGYIMKVQSTDRFLEAVHVVLSGEIYLSDRVKKMEESKAPKPVHQVLSDREISIFSMLGRGMSTSQLAAELFLSKKTVEKHRENIKRKLGITSTPKLIHEAAKWVCSVESCSAEVALPASADAPDAKS